MIYELIPFWSYGVKSLQMEILLNIILFIPVGLLAPRWKTVGLTAGYSMLIELAQLVSFRGLFEFDDVIHNAGNHRRDGDCAGDEAADETVLRKNQNRCWHRF